MLEKPIGQLGMDNTETSTTLDTRHRTKVNTSQKTKKISNTKPS